MFAGAIMIIIRVNNVPFEFEFVAYFNEIPKKNNLIIHRMTPLSFYWDQFVFSLPLSWPSK